MDIKPKNNKKYTRQVNVLESLKDIGSSTANTVKKDVARGVSQEFINQLLGKKYEKKYSGDIMAGEAIEMEEVYSGRREETLKLKNQLALERKLREEEKLQTEKKSNDLRIQLHALMQEVANLAKSTQDLGEETKLASMQAPIEPGVYHLVFFEKLLEFIKSFRKKIDDAHVWLHTTNSRAEKKNYWARYKKHGGKFLLAADHYLTRSAG